ncbi:MULTISPECIES: hypothetical protein [unclassified Paracoccus (in: a-proteobacteria)]|uniref:hypothetical protein n=1 Tax=unclassified Paracoccus (in: a-proteobacteria) TaxID=2688777 RepID=UPI0012B1CA8F|nr:MULTISPECIES: hypothetical protein [unclassified Paracoccus (in: a-proteobacteria)]UXU73760.1 hypothetical protein GB879_007360 [Paracoccus sp. SMMA_5]UXU79650.1 hypothetical protein GB880_007350 [Paracoccus sp. SMMA_5_TC]
MNDSARNPDPRRPPGLPFLGRGQALRLGQAALMAGPGYVITVESGVLTLRLPDLDSDDPLFADPPRWGVLHRLDGGAALRDAGIISLRVTAVDQARVVTELPPTARLAGITDELSPRAKVELILPVPGPAEPNLVIGSGPALPIRGADGGALPTGALRAGQSYLLRRRSGQGGHWRVIAGTLGPDETEPAEPGGKTWALTQGSPSGVLPRPGTGLLTSQIGGGLQFWTRGAAPSDLQERADVKLDGQGNWWRRRLDSRQLSQLVDLARKDGGGSGRQPFAGAGHLRRGPLRWRDPEVNELILSCGLPGCPPPLTAYPQAVPLGGDWLGAHRVLQPDRHVPLPTPWEGQDGNVIHPTVLEFYHGFRGYRYILGITGYPDRRERHENPLLYGSNDLAQFTLLSGMPQPLAQVGALPEPQNGHNSDIFLSHDPRSATLIAAWRQTIRLDGSDSAPSRVQNSLWFRQSRDGYDWSPPCRMIEASADHDSLMSPSLTFDPVRCEWHLWSVCKPDFRHRVAPRLTGPWSAPDRIPRPAGFIPHHLEVRYAGDQLLGLIHSMQRTNLFWCRIDSPTQWRFSPQPVIDDPRHGCYKASFLPVIADDSLAFDLIWTTGAGAVPDVAAGTPGPHYRMFVARSTACPRPGG